MEDFLSYEIGSIKTAIVQDIKKVSVTLANGVTVDKVTFFVIDDNNRNFVVSDALLSKKGKKVIKGLFLSLADNSKISSGSPLGKLLKHYNKKALKDFIGTMIRLTPDNNEYFVLIAGNNLQEK